MAHGVDPEFPVDVPLAFLRSSGFAQPVDGSVLERQVDGCVAVCSEDVT